MESRTCGRFPQRHHQRRCRRSDRHHPHRQRHLGGNRIRDRVAHRRPERIGGGDANDTYGGIGRNGAQKTPEAVFGQLLDVGATYTWNDHVLHNLQADAFIKDHSDVKGEQVAYSILSAIAST